jgi:hypothetical protein
LFRKDKQSGKLADEERERKLAEMMGNAKWRDEQRTKKVHQYREKEKVLFISKHKIFQIEIHSQDLV